ncbi:phosphate ABC transporter substrate-binding protein [Spiroplasma culicicola]|uniref:Phosphate ABC transporter substrate-binding protein n=1 Tax=Spiroplasma culicicola AES-1 TaxID=1276246 RepID=W6A876_9MOLU|nr:phosphate ABC transporter substrate-binding protein [Spiroplasma culicicola]AHI53181.1 phosphate ABC transporter substrate-binding protein [Spiroplasma culicicola AES-1]
MSKKLSIILISIFSVMVGLWIWSFVAPKNYVILGGSTSVNPFMQHYTKTYYEETGQDFIYNSTGSQAGVSGVEKEMYGAGFISKDVTDATLTDGYTFLDATGIETEFSEAQNFKETMNKLEILGSEQGKHNSYVGFEFALDAIVIIYKAPTWFTEQYEDKFNFKLENKTENALKEIYNGGYTWAQLARDIDGGANVPPNSNERITTFTREDGSGTRSAFSDLTGIKTMDTSNVVNSNGAMLENISSSGNAIGYVSYAFIKQITKESGVRVAGINDKKLGNPADAEENGEWEFAMKLNGDQFEFDMSKTNEEFIKDEDGYEFKRPFVSIYNTHSKHFNSLVDFFAEMIMAFDPKNPSNNFYQAIQQDFKDEGLVATFKLKQGQGE